MVIGYFFFSLNNSLETLHSNAESKTKFAFTCLSDKISIRVFCTSSGVENPSSLDFTGFFVQSLD